MSIAAVEASDDESIVEAIPHHLSKDEEQVDNGEVKDEAEEGDESEEVYLVERIVDHQIIDGVLKYEVRWFGYNRKEDNSWEPEENLENAADILQEYFDRQGGKPTVPAKGAKKRGRQSQGADTPDTAKKPKRGRLSQSAMTPKSPASSTAITKGSDWVPPKGSWEDKVQAVDTIESESGNLFVYLLWNDGVKSRHPIEKCYEKCPQSMLHFYEGHLVFKDRQPNGQ
ncbi:MAG: hypothetical protein M1830_006966 [Pleopsidium flavum]|nr:MAG: hypothetical protein M1830_006966 [Pleopsidium flavum]